MFRAVVATAAETCHRGDQVPKRSSAPPRDTLSTPAPHGFRACYSVSSDDSKPFFPVFSIFFHRGRAEEAESCGKNTMQRRLGGVFRVACKAKARRFAGPEKSRKRGENGLKRPTVHGAGQTIHRRPRALARRWGRREPRVRLTCTSSTDPHGRLSKFMGRRIGCEGPHSTRESERTEARASHDANPDSRCRGSLEFQRVRTATVPDRFRFPASELASLRARL